MVNQADTLKRLNEERDYEDKLIIDIITYLTGCTGNCDNCEYGGECMRHVNDLSPEMKKSVSTALQTIIPESQHHSFLFSKLIEMVLRHGEIDY